MNQTTPIKLAETDSYEWNPLSQMDQVDATGVGYAGLKGVTWNMLGKGQREIPLPGYVYDRFVEFAGALGVYLRTIHRLHNEDPALSDLFDHKRPEDRVKAMVGKRPTRFFRPDVVITQGADGELSFKVTEIESAPGGLGLFEAVRLAYERPAEQGNVIDHLVELINDRPFVVVLTHRWIDYIWDVCFACALLKERGIDVTVYIDLPEADLQSHAEQEWGSRQQDMPEYTSAQPNWDPHLLERLERHGFASFVQMVTGLPDELDTASVVYRMGYHGSFPLATMDRLKTWERKGSLILNGLHHGLESKVNMAALGVPSVRAALTPSIKCDVLGLLDAHVARTQVVDPAFANLNEICAMRKHGVLKVAAWDPDDFLCWGARGLVDGDDLTQLEWHKQVGHALAQPYPMVVQERMESVRQNFRGVCDRHGNRHNVPRARQRWTPMVVIDEHGQVHVDPGIITASSSFAAHGGVGSVMAPVKVV